MKNTIAIMIASAILLSGCVLNNSARKHSDEQANNNIVSTVNYGDIKRYSVSVQGKDREFIEYAPSQTLKNKDLILVFHGGGGSADRMLEQTKFINLAKDNNLAILFLNAENKNWNDGREGLTSKKDLDFVNEIVKLYRTKGVKKIMATGFSNGAIFTMRLACENTLGIQYYATIAGSIPENYNNVCKNSKNILMINGTKDNFVKWDGGEVTKGANMGMGGKTLPIEYSLKVWQENNKCVKSSIESINGNYNDESMVEKVNYRCASGSLVFYKINGGGHTIPGSQSKALSSKLIGVTNQDIMAEEEIVKFLIK